MVGVPRSTGCQTWVKRRCDESRPKCLRCAKLGAECLDYDLPLQIRNSGPDEAQQRQGSRAARSQSPSDRKSKQVLLLSSSPSVDEIVASSLAYEVLTTQTKEVFHDWLIYHFPRLDASFVFRVDIGWMDFIRHLTPSKCPPALLWAIRTLITFQMGTLQRNKEAIYFLDGNDDKSWTVHTHGIRQLMCARGSWAHNSGMGRILMICFRPFSFVMRKPCFLAGSEWTALTEGIFDDKHQRGHTELMAFAIDLIFNETAECPGYYALTEAIMLPDAEAAPSEIEALSSEICRTQNHLLKLQDKLILIQADLFVVPPVSPTSIPSAHIHSMTQLTLEGGLLALDAVDCPPPAVSSELTLSSTTEPIGDWLDRFSLVMGMTHVPGNAPKQLVECGSLDITGNMKGG
ncbi:hypothetical protein BJY01DRAFT_264459 [Aspergillus pseudoustus]|uniref:Zn(2)-C6 fungal-type domain-containing protein n=1 Tax=Aspergillus pseudoustus TaxID=1810923 RepID=A0ABR4JRQ8_9EURO